jgi:haloalkane dehalogenase
LVTATSEGLTKFADTPMMICWGMKDFVFDEAFLVEWERRFPDADVHRFDDCGHYVLEDAQEEIGELVQSFFGQ